MARKYTQDEFLRRAKEIHGESLDFSEFEYINSITPSTVKCNVCGHVWKTRGDVILRGCGCKLCSSHKSGDMKKIPFAEVVGKIDESIEIDESNYIDTQHACNARCKKCGHVWTPYVRDLINGHGCPNCYRLKISEQKEASRITKENAKLERFLANRKKAREKAFESFLSASLEKHGGKYDYSNVEYVNKDTKVRITCLWTRSYYCEAIGCINEETIQKYIENKKFN